MSDTPVTLAKEILHLENIKDAILPHFMPGVTHERLTVLLHSKKGLVNYDLILQFDDPKIPPAFVKAIQDHLSMIILQIQEKQKQLDAVTAE